VSTACKKRLLIPALPRKMRFVTNSDEASMAAISARADKILVVDDDARIRDLLRRYLTQHDFEVLLAEDGKRDAACDAARNGRPDRAGPDDAR
jgi:PleD family two-component response regulator